MIVSVHEPRKSLARNLGIREQESRQCRRCDAGPGRQCVTASGTAAPRPHAERRNDSRRANGSAGMMEHEGMFLDRFPPRVPEDEHHDR